MKSRETFATAEELVGYIDLRSESQRALVHQRHMIQFAYIAGQHLAGKVTWEDYSVTEPGMGFVSLHSYDVRRMVAAANKRIRDGKVPTHWRDDLEYKLKTGRWHIPLE